jgi:hypothetical protein
LAKGVRVINPKVSRLIRPKLAIAETFSDLTRLTKMYRIAFKATQKIAWTQDKSQRNLKILRTMGIGI